MLVAIGMLIPRLFGARLSDRAARALAIVILVVLAALLFRVGKQAYERSVIVRYNAEQAALRRERDRAAEEEADRQQARRTAELEQENRTLEAAATEAAVREPEKARTTVGPVTRSYYETLRKEKK